jgi:hypothetical protein
MTSSTYVLRTLVFWPWVNLTAFKGRDDDEHREAFEQLAWDGCGLVFVIYTLQPDRNFETHHGMRQLLG